MPVAQQESREPTRRPAGGCSGVSLALAEPLLPSAEEPTRWLLLEQPGPWGRDALMESDVPAAVARALGALAETLDLKVLLIRRSARRIAPDERTCLLVCSQRGNTWIEHHRLRRVEEVLDLDLRQLGAGRRSAPARTGHPALYLTCTHGRRDACCARLGRPLARALAAVRPDAAWQCSHLGGHRFAPTCIAFPQALFYGRLPAARAGDLVAAHERGELLLEHLRGRAGDPLPVQAAEGFARERLSLRGIDDLTPIALAELGQDWEVAFRTAGGGRITATVRWSSTGRPRRTDCRSGELDDPGIYELVRLDAAL